MSLGPDEQINKDKNFLLNIEKDSLYCYQEKTYARGNLSHASNAKNSNNSQVKGIKNETIKNKGQLPLEQIDLEGFETLNKVYNQAWDREI